MLKQEAIEEVGRLKDKVARLADQDEERRKELATVLCMSMKDANTYSDRKIAPSWIEIAADIGKALRGENIHRFKEEIERLKEGLGNVARKESSLEKALIQEDVIYREDIDKYREDDGFPQGGLIRARNIRM